MVSVSNALGVLYRINDFSTSLLSGFTCLWIAFILPELKVCLGAATVMGVLPVSVHGLCTDARFKVAAFATPTGRERLAVEGR